MKTEALSFTLMIVMARAFMALAGLLLLSASGGCGGGYGPTAPETDGSPWSWPDGGELDAWRTISDGHATDGACSGLGMQCGAASATVHATPGTCTYPLPCELLGADRLHIVTGDIELPMDSANGWNWADAMTAVAINGPLCADVMNGSAVDLMIFAACGPIN